MTRKATDLVHIFILDGIAKVLKDIDSVLGSALQYHELHNSDESRRVLLKTFEKMEDIGHTLLEIMVEETLHEQIALYQKTIRLLPRAKYAALMNMKHRTAEEETMHEALSPV